MSCRGIKVATKEQQALYRKLNKEKIKLARQKYYAKNRDIIIAKAKDYYQMNKEAKAVYDKEYVKSRREIRRQQGRKRYKSDVIYKLSLNLRNRLNRALERNSKKGSAVRDLGCSLQEFKQYIEEQFRDGMSWGNHGEVWHLDHILPLANYQLSDRGTFRRLCHYTNYQPLLVSENLAKNNNEEYTLQRYKSGN